MHIVVVNAGSSSVKLTCFGPDRDQAMAEGYVERIGLDNTRLSYRPRGAEAVHQPARAVDTGQAIAELAEWLVDPDHGVLESTDQVGMAAHRVVQGGDINQPRIIDQAVKEMIQRHVAMAPLHNPPNLAGIAAAETIFPRAVQVAVFDTAFHADLPRQAYLYALPSFLRHDHKIRRYGFHGISHKYVSGLAAGFFDRPAEGLRLISCHLGNGCSVAAIKGGRSMDTSMGFTPLEGLVMGTRCGDIDPAVIFHLADAHGMQLDEINSLLNRQGGLLGLSGGRSSDMRDIIAAMKRGDGPALDAFTVFCYRLKKYIGAYTAALGGVDGVIFTGGIGENSPEVRAEVIEGLEGLGLAIDQGLNAATSDQPREIQPADSGAKVLVIPTNEAKEIMQQACALLEVSGKPGE